MYKELRFRRQFIISRAPITELDDWNCMRIGLYHLHAHPDLEVTAKQERSRTLILLGYIFDPIHPAKSNLDIVFDVISCVNGFDDFVAAIKRYTGRYAFIYLDKTFCAVLHDPLGLREVYYCSQTNKVVCGSQPNLLEAFSVPRLGVTQDQSILHFYQQDMKQVRSGRLWVGDDTLYHAIKHLMPNHYLNIQSLTARRYWPNRRLERLDLDIAVMQSCDYLKGVLNAVTSRYDVMMAVTSGIDSRSLLAASREVRDKIYYFINKHGQLNDNSSDIRIPRNIFSRLNIPFHVHHVAGEVDEKFKEIFLNNVFMSTELILPTIYHVYYEHHQNKVNLLGVGEIGRNYYGEAPRDLDGYYLARCLKYKRSSYAVAQCEQWLREVRTIAEACNVDIMRLLLWECLLGNWGAVGNSESDIAIEEFDPYDSHYIYETIMSVNPSQGDLFRELFREMWPELLEFPFNPPETMREWIALWLQRMGLLSPVKRQVYRFERWRFLRSGGSRP